jgi:TPR repeat protein
MSDLGCIHHVREEYEQAAKWFTKGAEAGLPKAMFYLGIMLEKVGRCRLTQG